jgi:glucose-specific phosphotransferase system IIA component
MGFFKKIFKEKKEQIVALTNGQLVDISEVPDEVFSTKMMGDGFAMKTIDGIVVSPVDGKIGTVFPTKHAITINSVDGREILIHLGVDTVKLKGEGFEAFVKENQDVKVGDKLVKMDVDFIEKNAKSSMPIVIFTNLEGTESVKIKEGSVTAGESNRIEIIK